MADPFVPESGLSASPTSWSPAQLMRLENEWRRLARMYAYHPHVRIMPLAGDPPDQYQVEYRLRTILMDQAGQLQYATSASVHIWLPPEFPHESPLVRPISAIYHPNVVSEGIAIVRPWQGPQSTLVDVVAWVGQLLAWQDYDSEAEWNPSAMHYLAGNPHLFPTDPTANLSPDAGGDALARICRFGPRSLEQMRAQLKQFCDSLLAADGAPGTKEIVSLSQRTRQSLIAFLEDDVSDDLRAPAGELDEFARELGRSSPTWELLRQQRGLADAAVNVTRQLREIEQTAVREIAAVDALSTFHASADAMAVLRRIPPLAELQLKQKDLLSLVSRSEKLLGEGRAILDRWAKLSTLDISRYVSSLARRLEAERDRAMELGADARKELSAALAQFHATGGQAKVHVAALHRVIDWRTFADMLDRGEERCGKALEWGPSAIEAIFVTDDAGRHGPFDLERRIQIGERSVAVRNPAALSIELISAGSGEVIGRSDEGRFAIDIRHGEKSRRVEIELAGNCEEIAVQLEYLSREMEQLWARLAPEVRAPKSWIGQVIAALSTAAARGAVKQEHDRMVGRWRTLCDDLHTLSAFKQRIATFRMIERTEEAASRIASDLAAEAKALDECTRRIAAIVAASGRDQDTNQLRIAAKYAKEYPQRMQRRQLAQRRIPRLEAMRRRMIDDIRARMNDQRLRGLADRPRLMLLAGGPESDLLEQLSDGGIAGRLRRIEKHLGEKLIPAGFGEGETALWPTRAPEPVAELRATATPAEDGAAAGAMEDQPAASIEGELQPAPETNAAEGEFQINATDDAQPAETREEWIDFDPNAGKQSS